MSDTDAPRTRCGFCVQGVIDFGEGPEPCPYCNGTGYAGGGE